MLHPFGGFEDFNLPTDDAVINALFSDVDFAHISLEQKDQALALLEQFSDIFAEGPHDFGLAKRLINQINTGNALSSKPSRTAKAMLKKKPFQRS